MLYGFVHHGTDSPFSTKACCTGDLLNSFFHHVQHSSQRVCNLRLNFTCDLLFLSGGDRVMIILPNGHSLYLFLCHSLSVMIRVITLAFVKDR